MAADVQSCPALRDSPGVWFSMLCNAISLEDFALAAEAKANLDEAGLNLALNSSDKFQFSYEETQREFETKMSEFRTHFRGADEFGKHLYDRRCALDRRLEVYKREIERRMPTQRD